MEVEHLELQVDMTAHCVQECQNTTEKQQAKRNEENPFTPVVICAVESTSLPFSPYHHAMQSVVQQWRIDLEIS